MRLVVTLEHNLGHIDTTYVISILYFLLAWAFPILHQDGILLTVEDHLDDDTTEDAVQIWSPAP